MTRRQNSPGRSRMLGLISTKWSLFTETNRRNPDKPRGRRQARAIDRRDMQAEIDALLMKSPGPFPWLEDDDFDVQRAEDCYQSHPWTPGEGRCTECFTERIDAFVYFIRCTPEREPMNHTSESGPFEMSPGVYSVSPEFERLVGKKNLERINRRVKR